MASSCTSVDIILCYYTSNIDILLGRTRAGSTDSTLCYTHRVFKTPIEPPLRRRTILPDNRKPDYCRAAIVDNDCQ